MAVVFMLLTLLLPLPVGNDAQLVVTVHDERGEGVAGIVVEAHAADEQAPKPTRMRRAKRSLRASPHRRYACV
jgi:hypothetical protein